MNFIKKLPVVFLLLMMICSSSTIKRTDITFADYLKTLDTIPLPFEHACTGQMLPELSMHFNSTGFQKYRDRNCARPLGILFNDRYNIITVDLSNADECVAPVLVSFDKSGRKLDYLRLYDDAYGNDDSAIMPYFKIDKNKRIVIIDTLKKWKIDAYTKKAQDAPLITIDSTIYYLSKNGKFIKEKPKK